MARIITVYISAGFPSAISVWWPTSSCSLSAGTTSQGTIAPSTTPLDRASGICGTGMATGVPPSREISLVEVRLAARIFLPRKSAILLMGFLPVWISAPSVVWVASRCMPVNSFSPCLATNSHIAWLDASAERLMNGCSKTEMSGKRPLL